MFISTSSEDEELSIALAKSWYNKLATFYINKSIERQQTTYQLLSFKADSIYRLLAGSESSLATSAEKRGLVLASDNLPQARSSRNIQMYAAMYGEVIKNKETAEFILNNETPFFQVIDEPLRPLSIIKPSLVKNLIIGGIAGAFLTIFIFVGIRIKNEMGL
jgi:nucleoside diphosphate kinase